MGATVEFYKVKCKKNELDNKANELREEARYDYGHSGYTGTIAEDNGSLKIVNELMSVNDAEEYIDNNAQKWEETIAIPVEKNDDGTTTFLLGGVYSC